jgi:hypothetical protein
MYCGRSITVLYARVPKECILPLPYPYPRALVDAPPGTFGTCRRYLGCTRTTYNIPSKSHSRFRRNVAAPMHARLTLRTGARSGLR